VGLARRRTSRSVLINATRSFNDHWDRFIANATYRRFLEGLDRFYAEERNSKIEIQHGMWIVMNEIAGMSKTKLETMIDAWRQKDGE
jgi:hypothetical protein